MKSMWRTRAREGRGASLVARRPSLLALLALLALTACTVTRPIVKLGLVAPFEGQYRSIGYDVIWAVRLAVREANATGQIPGYGLELVSLDDMGDDARAAEQAAKLSADPAVIGVLGHWRAATSQTTGTLYAEAGLAWASTGAAPDGASGRVALWDPAACLISGPTGCIDMLGAEDTSACMQAPLARDSADPAFAERYQALSGGIAPSFAAVLAYDGARALIAAMADAAEDGAPTRARVAAALPGVTLEGLTGRLAWSPAGDRVDAPRWGYTRIDAGSDWRLDAAACPP